MGPVPVAIELCHPMCCEHLQSGVHAACGTPSASPRESESTLQDHFLIHSPLYPSSWLNTLPRMKHSSESAHASERPTRALVWTLSTGAEPSISVLILHIQVGGSVQHSCACNFKSKLHIVHYKLRVPPCKPLLMNTASPCFESSPSLPDLHSQQAPLHHASMPDLAPQTLDPCSHGLQNQP